MANPHYIYPKLDCRRNQFVLTNIQMSVEYLCVWKGRVFISLIKDWNHQLFQPKESRKVGRFRATHQDLRVSDSSFLIHRPNESKGSKTPFPSLPIVPKIRIWFPFDTTRVDPSAFHGPPSPLSSSQSQSFFVTCQGDRSPRHYAGGHGDGSGDADLYGAVKVTNLGS